MIAPFTPEEILNNLAKPINKTTHFPNEYFNGSKLNIASILTQTQRKKTQRR